ALAVADERLGPGHREVHPPAAEREADAGESKQRGFRGPARLAVYERIERGDRADDDLAERDDRQQAKALRDVVRVPGSAALAFGDHWADGPDPDRRDKQEERR